MTGQNIACAACHGLIGSRLPGGVVRFTHKRRSFTLYTGYLETTCGLCGHLNAVEAGAAPCIPDNPMLRIG